MGTGSLTPRERLVRLAGMAMAVTFAAVGVVFLVVPGEVLSLLNTVGDVLGAPVSTTDAFTLYLALAVAYMYLVTLLAVQMARRPQVRAYPWLLVQAKAASAVLCLVLFVAQDQYFVYAANALVDGLIAVCVWALALRGAPEGSPQDAATSRVSGQGLGDRPASLG